MKKDLAKLTLFRELVYNQPKELSLDYFSELLNISKRSTLRTVEELTHDLEKEFENVEIIKNKYSYSIVNYSLMNNEYFIVRLQMFYFKNSIQFNIIYSLLTKYFDSMSQLSDYLYISTPHLYRQMPEIKRFLAGFKIDIVFNQTKQKTNFVGSQKHLKTFYYFFYWGFSQGIEWPFEDLFPLKKFNETFQLAFTDPSHTPAKTKKLEVLFLLSYLDKEDPPFKLSEDIKEIATIFKNINDVSTYSHNYLKHEDQLLFINLLSRISMADLDNDEEKIAIYHRVLSSNSPIVTRSIQLTESIFAQFFPNVLISIEDRAVTFYYIFIFHIYIHYFDIDLSVLSTNPISLKYFSTKSEQFKLIEQEIIRFFTSITNEHNIKVDEKYLNSYYFLIASIIDYVNPMFLKIYIQYSKYIAGKSIIKSKLFTIFGKENIVIVDNINDAKIIISDCFENERPGQILFLITGISRPEMWQNLMLLILKEKFQKSFRFPFLLD
ncbi:MAG: helix-turn-helix domain-containing protein [Carnobacterium sp.]